MARFSFRLPDIGEGIAEAEIVAWHVKVGDRIEEDSQLADMMTDKATVEMESPVTGVVVELAGEVGDMVAIGSTLAVIEVEGEGQVEEPASPTKVVEAETPSSSPQTARPELVEAPSSSSAPEQEKDSPSTSPHRETGQTEFENGLSPSGPAEKGAKTLASPAVRARAADLGIDLAQVYPADGERVRHADLDAYLRYSAGQGYHAPHSRRGRADEAIKVVGMRRRIAENMSASKRAIPHFAYVEEIDVTALEAMRADLNGARGNRPKLTMLPLLIVAICRTVPQFPMINARYDDDAGVVTRHGAVHLGMATQTDAGLMVPVIRDAQEKNVWQLASEISRLADTARSGKAKPEELSGSTLTITSLGPLGGIATTPVINKPEVAIIGPNKIVERPIFVGDDIVRAKLMNLSISCDHRVVDGWDAASFVQALKKLLETPVLLFAD
ncbi:MAG: dihydrolipoamide acetyltransferase family protein [Sphingopyxis sp.]|nr:dihydrolipoamide acetyltransferase family protein [Sphingopyxis sp.]